MIFSSVKFDNLEPLTQLYRIPRFYGPIKINALSTLRFLGPTSLSLTGWFLGVHKQRRQNANADHLGFELYIGDSINFFEQQLPDQGSSFLRCFVKRQHFNSIFAMEQGMNDRCHTFWFQLKKIIFCFNTNNLFIMATPHSLALDMFVFLRILKIHDS